MSLVSAGGGAVWDVLYTVEIVSRSGQHEESLLTVLVHKSLQRESAGAQPQPQTQPAGTAQIRVCEFRCYDYKCHHRHILDSASYHFRSTVDRRTTKGVLDVIKHPFIHHVTSNDRSSFTKGINWSQIEIGPKSLSQSLYDSGGHHLQPAVRRSCHHWGLIYCSVTLDKMMNWVLSSTVFNLILVPSEIRNKYFLNSPLPTLSLSLCLFYPVVFIKVLGFN